MTDNVGRLLQVAVFAANKHRDQRRKNELGAPYINHPLEVASILANEGGVQDFALLAAALLHDTVEDTDTSFDELEEKFGREIRDLVAEVTDDKSLPKAERKQLQVEHAPTNSERARQLKIADKTCNVRDIGCEPPANWDRQRRDQYLDWAVQVVAGCRGVNPRLDDHFDRILNAVREQLAESAD